MQYFSSSFKVGILGAGQLGKMLALAALPMDLQVWMLDQHAEFPGAGLANRFVQGDFKDYDDVLNFGRQCDVVTIEIEHVNIDALFQLEREGVTVHPNPQALAVIKDKGLQKEFYAQNGLPTAPFDLYASADEIRKAVEQGTLTVPFVQKSRTAGYDGKGVFVCKTADDLEQLLETPSMVEALAPIDKEIAVIAARNASGDIELFDAVEMRFHPVANLVEFLQCPADISAETATELEELSRKVITAFDVCGVLAIEFFLLTDGTIWINEVAPRPHNSGHQTIESSLTSQYQQHLRGILDLPLGATTARCPAIMVNLLGEDGSSGPVCLDGFRQSLAIPGVYLHLYGKKTTKPFRKMGHATILADTLDQAETNARRVQSLLRIYAKSTTVQ